MSDRRISKSEVTMEIGNHAVRTIGHINHGLHLHGHQIITTGVKVSWDGYMVRIWWRGTNDRMY